MATLILVVILGGGLLVMLLKSSGDLCPRCGHWERDYPMCSHPWHREDP